MKYDFTRNSKTIQEINRDFLDGRLIIDRSYQRRKVWNNEDKVRLIETILLGLVMPEVFFWAQSTEPETGYTTTHVVDGQQRITTIAEYVAGDFQLTEKCLLDETIKKNYGSKFFYELDDAAKTRIWQYPVSIVNIDPECSLNVVKTLFYRLNLTNYSLNMQEKRNSKDSAFGDKSEALSTLDFWNEKKVFSASDAKRMKDVEFCCSIYILANEGIVDQTNGKKINDYYDDYAKSFDVDCHLENRITGAMEIINELTDKQTIQFVSKKAQMYSLFCMAFKMIDNNISLNKHILQKFRLFVSAYSLFRNDMQIECDTDEEKIMYERLKKYKLASSEGINKVTNRVIRFQELYEVCVDSSDIIINVLKKLRNKLDQRFNNLIGNEDKFEADDIEEC